MARLLKQRQKDGVGFVAVAEGGDLDAIVARAPVLGVEGHVAVADETSDAAFDVTLYPTTFLVAPDGRILDRIERGTSPPELAARLDTALAHLK